jgi:molybdopterin molybdotransferase
MNVPWLTVRRRPRVAYAATGDEVVMPGDPLGPDQIISSNSVALDAYIRVLGGKPINLGIARDNEESLRQVLEGAKGADLLVTLGGASVGDFDFVKKVLGEDGMDLGFYKVAMRPGKPLIFGRLNGIPVLGLPGNPVSAGVTSVIFLKAAIAEMLGISDAAAGPLTALLGRDVEENDHRQDYLRAKLSHDKDGHLVAIPFEGQDSSMMARLAEADCLLVRPPNAKAAKKGEAVEIISLGGGSVLF